MVLIMKALHKNILERLDQIINNTGDHIHDFINNPHAFTRKRTLDAATVLKTTINMQGQNLNSELFRAFGEDATKKNDKVVSTSAYVQRKSQLSPACFKHILTVFNQDLFNIQLLIITTVCLPLMALTLIKSGIRNRITLYKLLLIKRNPIVKFTLMPYMIY